MSETNGEKKSKSLGELKYLQHLKKIIYYVIKVDLHISGKNKIILIKDTLISKSLRTAIILTI